MSITHTSDEAINQVAALLGKFVPGEALGAVEHDTIDASLDNVLAELTKIVAVNKEQIPDIYFETICRQIAVYAAAKFSNIPKDMNEVLINEQRLRYLVAQSPTYEILAGNYF